MILDMWLCARTDRQGSEPSDTFAHAQVAAAARLPIIAAHVLAEVMNPLTSKPLPHGGGQWPSLMSAL